MDHGEVTRATWIRGMGGRSHGLQWGLQQCLVVRALHTKLDDAELNFTEGSYHGINL